MMRIWKNKLQVREEFSWEEKKLAVQTAFIFGFQSERAKFPVASLEGDMEIPVKAAMEELLAPFQLLQEIPQDYVDATRNAKEIPAFDWRNKKGLESLFAVNGEFLLDENNDLLPDQLNFQIILPKEASSSILIAACNISFRFGMETTGFSGSLLAEEYQAGNAIIFRESEKCRVYIEDDDKGARVYVEGTGEEVEMLSSKICESFPNLSAFDTWIRRLQKMTDDFAMRELDGQLAYLEAIDKDDKEVEAYFSPEIEERIDEIQAFYPEVKFKNYKGNRIVYEKQYEISWEVDELRNILETQLYPNLKLGDFVEVHAAISEEAEIRESIRTEIEAELRKRNVEIVENQILCSYKQGFSWLEERVIPQMQECENLKRVVIAFRAFLPEGVTTWQDEDGVTPSYNNIGGDAKKWYDLPIRYLQELYPIIDVLTRELQIDKNDVEFVLYEGDEDITYEVIGEDITKKKVYRDTYKARCFERPYLNQYENMGKVHPATGYLQVKVNGALLWEHRIETDVEKIWDIYQAEVLPDCRAFMEDATNEHLTVQDQPFFAKLQMEVVASEPNYRLPSREDLFSTLDGLHEDMYFVGADYFKNYGMERFGEMLEEVGLILPIIEQGEGAPSFKVTLFDHEKFMPMICVDGEEISRVCREDISLSMKEIAFEDGKYHVKLQLDGVNTKVAKAYMHLLQENMILQEQDFGICQVLHIFCEDEEYTAELCKELQDKNAENESIESRNIENKNVENENTESRNTENKNVENENTENENTESKNLESKNTENKKTKHISDIDLMENKLISYEEYLHIIEELKCVSGIEVYQTATSYEGRKIYAIELQPVGEGYLSRTKRITNYPSEIINSRHHANEVSATNAAFILLKKLLTEPQFENLADKLNLVIVPMENVDGAALHYELQKKNPYWKFHVARFNAIGKEFYHEHFKADTKHTEAYGLTRLFETFLPDVMIDNHGVPTHEWEQQFSGYTSPSYKGFWLPRSLLYGYFWTVSDECYQSNYVVNKKLEDVIAQALMKQPEMQKLNQEWAWQFEKYAHAWLPKLFPANYYKEMINYWIPFKADQAHRYPSVRFPWITTVAYTSEVADETAQGDYLNLCARAHVAHDVATIHMLINARSIYENKAVITADTMKLAHTRLRPMIV